MSDKKILIVEDEKAASDALKMKLVQSGYLVESTSDGGEALKKLPGDFSLILLDLVMPNVNGFDFLEQFNKLNLNIPVFVISNLNIDSAREKVYALGAKKFFVKVNTSLSDIVKSVYELFLHE